MAAERGHFHAPPPRVDNDASGFVRFYRANFDDENSKTLEKDDDTNNNKTLRFFNRKNDGWSAHGEDAMYVARRFYKTTTVVKYLKDGECTLPSVNVNQNLFETICRDVLLRTRERTVEVYESERGNAKDFKLTRRGSPGNVLDFEDVLFDGSKENDLNAMTANGNNIDTDSLPIVCAVKCILKQEQRRIGLTFF